MKIVLYVHTWGTPAFKTLDPSVAAFYKSWEQDNTPKQHHDIYSIIQELVETSQLKEIYDTGLVGLYESNRYIGKSPKLEDRNVN